MRNDLVHAGSSDPVTSRASSVPGRRGRRPTVPHRRKRSVGRIPERAHNDDPAWMAVPRTDRASRGTWRCTRRCNSGPMRSRVKGPGGCTTRDDTDDTDDTDDDDDGSDTTRNDRRDVVVCSCRLRNSSSLLLPSPAFWTYPMAGMV